MIYFPINFKLTANEINDLLEEDKLIEYYKHHGKSGYHHLDFGRAKEELTNKIMYFPALKSYFRELNEVSKRGLKISFSGVFQILKNIKITKSISKIVLRDTIICNINTLYQKYF